MAFVVAALVDNLLSGPQTEAAVIAVHLVIGAVSFALLAWFARGAMRAHGWLDPERPPPRRPPWSCDMNVLVVYASQFGNTERLAPVIGAALEPRHQVRVVRARDARALTGDGVDLLLVPDVRAAPARALVPR